MNLKSLFYPKVMFIENALKSYVIEAILNNSHSYKKEYIKRMQEKLDAFIKERQKF